MSLAYSGSICWTVPVPRVARCHAIRKVAKIAMETSAARNVSERVMGGCTAIAASLCWRSHERDASRDDVSAAASHTRLIAKLLMYSSGFDGSKVLPITENDFVVVVGGVSPTSFISFAVSVAR